MRDKNKDNDKNSFNKGMLFPKVIVGIVMLIIIAIIGISYFFSEEKNIITSQIVTLVIVLAILSIIWIFDSLQIGNVITLKKEKKQIENNLTEARGENEYLKLQLNTNLAIKTLQSSTTNVYLTNPPNEEFNQEDKKEEKAIETTDKERSRSIENNRRQFRMARAELEDILLKKFCQKNNLLFEELQRGIALEIDSNGEMISTRKTLYDGYYKRLDEELFIEIKETMSIIGADSVYQQLSRILNYRVSKNSRARMVLILPTYSEKVKETYGIYNQDNVELRIMKDFEPAIKNGLLHIEKITLTDEDVQSAIKEAKKNIQKNLPIRRKQE